MACTKCNSCADAGCLQIVYPDCIVTKVAYPCIGVGAGVTGTALFAAINSAICALQQAGSAPTSCPTWTAVTSFVDPIQNLTWSTASGSVTGFSSTTLCKAGLRGTLKATVPIGSPLTLVASQLFVITDIASRPKTGKVLSVNVSVESDGKTWVRLFLPGQLLVQSTGEVILSFSNFNPYIAIPGCGSCPGDGEIAKVVKYFVGGTTLTFTVSLDGVSYDIAN